MADASDHRLLEGSMPRGQWRVVSQEIHKIGHRLDVLIPLLPGDPWKLSLDTLGRLASGIGDGEYANWVRTDTPALIIGGVKERVTVFKRGSSADKLLDELDLLASQTKQILVEKSFEAPVRAAAFFHLKFGNSHPLKDGNGRTGRLLLAAQCANAYQIPIVEIVRDIEQFQRNYRQVFRVTDECLRFELLLELLALVLGLRLSKEVARLPFSTDASFPDLTPLPDLSEIGAKRDEEGRLLVGVSSEFPTHQGTALGG